jgi:hypothetical protein
MVFNKSQDEILLLLRIDEVVICLIVPVDVDYIVNEKGGYKVS